MSATKGRVAEVEAMFPTLMKRIARIYDSGITMATRLRSPDDSESNTRSLAVHQRANELAQACNVFVDAMKEPVSKEAVPEKDVLRERSLSLYKVYLMTNSTVEALARNVPYISESTDYIRLAGAFEPTNPSFPTGERPSSEVPLIALLSLSYKSLDDFARYCRAGSKALSEATSSEGGKVKVVDCGDRVPGQAPDARLELAAILRRAARVAHRMALTGGDIEKVKAVQATFNSKAIAAVYGAGQVLVDLMEHPSNRVLVQDAVSGVVNAAHAYAKTIALYFYSGDFISALRDAPPNAKTSLAEAGKAAQVREHALALWTVRSALGALVERLWGFVDLVYIESDDDDAGDDDTEAVAPTVAVTPAVTPTVSVHEDTFGTEGSGSTRSVASSIRPPRRKRNSGLFKSGPTAVPLPGQSPRARSASFGRRTARRMSIADSRELTRLARLVARPTSGSGYMQTAAAARGIVTSSLGNSASQSSLSTSRGRATTKSAGSCPPPDSSAADDDVRGQSTIIEEEERTSMTVISPTGAAAASVVDTESVAQNGLARHFTDEDDADLMDTLQSQQMLIADLTLQLLEAQEEKQHSEWMAARNRRKWKERTSRYTVRALARLEGSSSGSSLSDDMPPLHSSPRRSGRDSVLRSVRHHPNPHARVRPRPSSSSTRLSKPSPRRPYTLDTTPTSAPRPASSAASPNASVVGTPRETRDMEGRRGREAGVGRGGRTGGKMGGRGCERGGDGNKMGGRASKQVGGRGSRKEKGDVAPRLPSPKTVERLARSSPSNAPHEDSRLSRSAPVFPTPTPPPPANPRVHRAAPASTRTPPTRSASASSRPRSAASSSSTRVMSTRPSPATSARVSKSARAPPSQPTVKAG